MQSLETLLSLNEWIEAKDEIIEAGLDVTGQILDARDIFFNFLTSFFKTSSKLFMSRI